jgi:hypothetical protein
VGRTCGTNGEKRNVYRLLVGKPWGRVHYEDQNIRRLKFKMGVVQIVLGDGLD